VDRLADRPTRGRAAGALASLLALFYTDLIGLLVILPLLAWMLLPTRANDAPRLRRCAVGVTLGFVLGAAPWIVFKAMHVSDLWRGYLQPFRLRESVELLGGMFATGHAFLPHRPERTWSSAGVLVLLAPLMVPGARSLWRAPRARIFVVLMVSGVCGMTIASIVVDALLKGREYFIYQPRNLLCLFYFFGAILWTGAGRLRPSVLRAGVAGLLLASALVGSLLMQGPYRGAFTVDRPRSDWRRVAAALVADAGGTPVVAVSRSPVLQLRYYSADIEARTSWGSALDVAELAPAAIPSSLYYVEDIDWWPVTKEEVDRWREAFAVREVARIDRVVVYALKPRR
jgi:hypothetical protein